MCKCVAIVVVFVVCLCTFSMTVTKVSCFSIDLLYLCSRSFQNLVAVALISAAGLDY